MAERIEARRNELGLSPGAFAKAAGLTLEGVAPVRKGYRRSYQDRVRQGVARALRWRYDALDLLMAGQDPVELNGDDGGPDDRVTAIERRLQRLEDAVDRLLRDATAQQAQ